VTLQATVEALFAQGSSADKTAARKAFFELQRALGRGEIRAAEPDATRLSEEIMAISRSLSELST